MIINIFDKAYCMMKEYNKIYGGGDCLVCDVKLSINRKLDTVAVTPIIGLSLDRGFAL